MYSKKDQLGFSTLAVLLLVFVVVLALGFYYITSKKSIDTTYNSESIVNENSKVENSNLDYVTYTEPSNTPEEMNNKTLNDLDSLMKDVDQNSTEDLTDLQ